MKLLRFSHPELSNILDIQVNTHTSFSMVRIWLVPKDWRATTYHLGRFILGRETS